MMAYENSPESPNQTRFSDCGFLLLHGLGSSHRGTYMTHVAKRLLGGGARTFRVDLPGAGQSYQHTELPPHGACAEQLLELIFGLSQKCGIRTWRIGGMSLGGNLALKLAILFSDRTANKVDPDVKVDKVVVMAPPIDLHACCMHMESGINRLYASYFMRSMRRQFFERTKRWPRWLQLAPQANFNTIREFDETVTAPLAGFDSAEHYYRMGSTKPDLNRIDIPTVVLVDKHDPIVPYEIFRDAQWSSTTRVQVTKRGGHIGYLARVKAEPESTTQSDSTTRKTKWTLSRWADEWIAHELLS
jgi:uncharacterized protein